MKIVLLITLVIIVLIVSTSVWYLYKSASWSAVNGKVVSSDIDEIYNQPGSLGNENKRTFDYKVQLAYEYSVDGKNYVGRNIYAALPNIFPTEQQAKETVDQYPEGKQVQVYFDPANPSRSCLITTKAIPLKGMIVFVIVIIVVIAIVFGGIFMMNKI